MAENRGTRIARALVELTGSNPRQYVPGSAVLTGRTLTWTEQCKSICRHHEGGCHSARVGYLPTGPVDPIDPPASPRGVRDAPLLDVSSSPGINRGGDSRG